jgi:hypothetical protein
MNVTFSHSIQPSPLLANHILSNLNVYREKKSLTGGLRASSCRTCTLPAEAHPTPDCAPSATSSRPKSAAASTAPPEVAQRCGSAVPQAPTIAPAYAPSASSARPQPVVAPTAPPGLAQRCGSVGPPPLSPAMAPQDPDRVDTKRSSPASVP